MPLVLQTVLEKKVISWYTTNVDEKELQQHLTCSVKSLHCFDLYLVRWLLTSRFITLLITYLVTWAFIPFPSSRLRI